MASYQTFTSPRTTDPDPVALLTSLRAIDPVLGYARIGSGYQMKKPTPWTAGEISTAQNALDTAPGLTPQLAAQRTIDAFPIEYRALILALVDAINVLRTHAAINLPAVTPAQALQSIRNKAATLS